MSQNILAYTAPALGAVATLVSSSGDVADTNAVATLAGAAGKTNFLSGLALLATGATAAGVVIATVTGLTGGTLSIPVAVPAGADVGVAPVVLNFDPPLPAPVNTSIVVTLPALGAGNLHAVATAWGAQR